MRERGRARRLHLGLRELGGRVEGAGVHEVAHPGRDLILLAGPRSPAAVDVRQRQEVAELVGHHPRRRAEIRAIGDQANSSLLPRLPTELRARDPIDQQYPDAVSGLVRRREEVIPRLVDGVGRRSRRHLFDDLLAGGARELDVRARFQEVARLLQDRGGVCRRPVLSQLAAVAPEGDDGEIRGNGDRHGNAGPRPRAAALARRPAGAHGLREIGEDGHRHLPAHAGVGDALTVAKRGRVFQILSPVDQKALHHHAEDRALSVGDLLREIVRRDGLPAVVLVAVAVARVDHEPRREARVDERGGRLLYAHRVVVGSARAAAKDDVTVGIAARGHDRAEPLLGDAEELVRVRGGAHHDAEIASVLVGQGAQAPPVVERGGRVVDRARPDDHDEPVVLAAEDAADVAARARDGLGAALVERLLLEQDRRRQERAEALDPKIAGAFRHGAQCTREGAALQRPRHVTLRPAVSRLDVLDRIQKKVLWLGTYMVHHANSLRPNPDGVKVGGHQASSSSIVSLLTALYFDALRPEDLVAVKAHASPAFYAIQYLRGRLTAEALRQPP